MARTLEEMNARIQALSELEDGWGEGDCTAINAFAIEGARAFAAHLINFPELDVAIGPLVKCGPTGITFELYSRGVQFMDIEIYAEGDYAVCDYGPDGSWPLTKDFKDAVKNVNASIELDRNRKPTDYKW